MLGTRILLTLLGALLYDANNGSSGKNKSRDKKDGRTEINSKRCVTFSRSFSNSHNSILRGRI